MKVLLFCCKGFEKPKTESGERYAEVNGVAFEYDYQPQRGEVEEVSDTPLESDIEVPVKQAEPQIDKTGAVNFHITDDDLGIGSN